MVRHASSRRLGCTLVVFGLSACLVTAVVGTATAQTCSFPSGSFGNAGFAAGYGIHQAGWRGIHQAGWRGIHQAGSRGIHQAGWRGIQQAGWRGWPLVCRPNPGCWSPCRPASCWPTVCPPTSWVCAPRICTPEYGWGGWGWPAWGWGGSGGWYGTSWYSTAGSVSLVAPFGGGTFFSGGVVPVPWFSPWYGGGWGGWYGATAPQRVGTTALATNSAAGVTRPKSAPVSNAATRQRAARLVAAGDRHLATAAGDATRLRAALDAYRRAAAIARDEPDTFIRQALVLEALGQAAAADKPLAQAVALDGRLAAAGSASRPGAPPDPAFGARAAGEPALLALRGQAILQQIAAAAPGDDRDGPAAEAIAWLAERWSGRWQGEPATAVVRR
jgi:hypothetical protein